MSVHEQWTLVILVCGLPASGKSHLCRLLQEHFQGNADDDASCQVIDYDEIERQLLVETQQALPEAEVAAVDDRPLLAWRMSRKRALEQLKDDALACGQPRQLILMDDNFYLTSMRKQCYKTCQELVVASNPGQRLFFGVIYMDSSVVTCLDRNRARDEAERVPDKVIQTMASRFEAPGSTFSVPIWEQRSIRVSAEDGMDDSLAASLSFISELRRTGILVEPPPDPLLQAARLQEEQSKTRASIMHQVDLQLRRQCVQAVASLYPQHARLANQVRRQVLAQLQEPHAAATATDEETIQKCAAVRAIDLYWRSLLVEHKWTSQEQDALDKLASRTLEDVDKQI